MELLPVYYEYRLRKTVSCNGIYQPTVLAFKMEHTHALSRINGFFLPLTFILSLEFIFLDQWTFSKQQHDNNHRCNFRPVMCEDAWCPQ